MAAVKRAVDEQGQPVTSLSGDPADGDVGAGSEAFQRLKSILSSEFADAVTVEKEIGLHSVAIYIYIFIHRLAQ